MCSGSSSHAASRPLAGKRALVLLFSYYLTDPRPRRAAEVLADAGMEVEVICLCESKDEPSQESVSGVKIHRIRLRKRRGGKAAYVLQYVVFILSTFLMSSLRSISRHYHLVHVHNMPDVLVFAALVPKLLGAKVVLDLHDPMPELMTAIFGFQEGHLGVRLLKLLEKVSIAFADAVVTVNLACKKIFTARSCPAEKLHVVMNSPDEAIFAYREVVADVSPQRGDLKPFVLMYHGSIVERHGLDLAVQALQAVRQSVPNVVLRVYGRSTPFLEEVMAVVEQCGLQDSVQYLGAMNSSQLVAAIDECDVGLIPNRRSIFTEINTPTRIFEFLSRGKPVVAPRARGILDYFADDSLVLFELGDGEDLARKIKFVHAHPVQVSEITKCGQAIYRAHLWSEERLTFLALVDRLLGNPNTQHSDQAAPDTVHSS